jgi:hypothetical protein
MRTGSREGSAWSGLASDAAARTSGTLRRGHRKRGAFCRRA